MKKCFNLYLDEVKLQELKERARQMDVPTSTLIKLKLFSNELKEEQNLN